MRKTLLKGILILSLPCIIFFSCKKSSTEVSSQDVVSSSSRIRQNLTLLDLAIKMLRRRKVIISLKGISVSQNPI